MTPDLVLDNANLITIDPGRPRAGSLAIMGDRIVAVGDRGELTGARVIDLGGRTVVPGFNDAHNHMQIFGGSKSKVNLSPTIVRSVEEIVSSVAERVAQTPPGVWVMAAGYDDDELAERRHPTRAELDRVSPRQPRRALPHLRTFHRGQLPPASGWPGWVRLAVPEGGVVALGDDGLPNGLLEEQAQTLVGALLHPMPLADIVANIVTASDLYLSEGITSCQEAGVGGILGTREPLEVAAYQHARASGGLRVRVMIMMPSVENLHTGAHHPDDDQPFALDLGLHSGFGDEWLKFGPTKIFDGSLIGRTAAMFEDFVGEPGNSGYFQMPEETLHTLIIKAHISGWQVATHAIGDRAVASVLDAYEEAQRLRPRADTRHRIEHCGMTRAEDVERIARLGVIPVTQGRFISEIGDGMLRAIGDRHPDCYRQRTPRRRCRPSREFRSTGGRRLAVARHPRSGEPAHRGGRPVNPQEALTPEQAIRAYTYASAYAAFDEAKKGSLSVGKLADLTVLDQDLTTITPEQIAETQVLATMVGGSFEFDQLGLST